LENKQVLQLSSSVDFTIWDSYDDEHKIVRFVTSWATTEDEIERLAECIQDFLI
jgi:threonine aldolase